MLDLINFGKQFMNGIGLYSNLNEKLLLKTIIN